MSTNNKIFVTLAALALAAGGVAYFSLARPGRQSDPVVDSGVHTPQPVSTAPSPEQGMSTPATRPGATELPPLPGAANDPASTVAALIDARFNNDEAKAKQAGSDDAVRQIYSFPPFNAREASVACSEQGSKATCSVSAPAAGGSMIVSLSKTTAGWRVEQIEPVID